MRNNEITEGLGELADGIERDHEVQMARAELYKMAKYTVHLHKMLANVSEAEGLEGWVQSKITKAADMIGSVYHHLDYETNAPDAMAEGKDEKERLSSLYKQLEKMKKSNDKDGVEHTQGLIVQAKKNLGMNEAQSPAQKAAFAKMLAKKSGKKPAFLQTRPFVLDFVLHSYLDSLLGHMLVESLTYLLFQCLPLI